LNTGPKSPAVFFDRDGTLMEEVDYCKDPKDVRLFPGVVGVLGRLKAAGFMNIIITNQAGIGRGYMTGLQYRAVEAEVLKQIGAGLIAGTYFCPDAPWQPSSRRKPKLGMVLEAVETHCIDLSASFFVGDKTSDIECGRNAGVRTILVQTGYGMTQQDAQPDFIAKDVVAAVDIILENRNV
jgi:histidinol-phosphate phosphatase family protein